MEKAHEEIQDYFLQIFDKGEARDSQGRPADFRRTIFVMTCNIGADAGVAGFRAGAAPAATAVPEKELRAQFRGEFLGRIDRIVPFRALDAGDYRALLDRRLAALAQDLEKQGVRVEVADRPRDPLARACSDGGGGARGFVQALERLVLAPVLAHARANAGRPALRVDWNADRLLLSSA